LYAPSEHPQVHAIPLRFFTHDPLAEYRSGNRPALDVGGPSHTSIWTGNGSEKSNWKSEADGNKIGESLPTNLESSSSR
jgi:hypothetical protein